MVSQKAIYNPADQYQYPEDTPGGCAHVQLPVPKIQSARGAEVMLKGSGV